MISVIIRNDANKPVAIKVGVHDTTHSPASRWQDRSLNKDEFFL